MWLARARSVTNSLDKYLFNAVRQVRAASKRDRETERQRDRETRSSTDNICSEVKVKFYLVAVAGG